MNTDFNRKMEVTTMGIGMFAGLKRSLSIRVHPWFEFFPSQA
jgi:hypothetical protein